MPNSRILNCLGILVFSALTQAQTPPTTYTITEAGGDAANPITTTVYRNGLMALMDVRMASSRSLTLYDVKAGTSYSWNPADKPIACSAGTFSGDWGDLDDEDRQANELALVDGSRLLSSYRLRDGTKIWIITEAADERGRREATTTLLPSDY